MGITYAILVIYLGIMLGIGFYGRKFADNVDSYLTAGRQGTMLMLAGSFMASHIGSGFVVGGAEYGALWGIGGVWYGLACAFSYFLFAPLVARRVYQGNFMTVSDYLEDRYNDKFTQTGFAIMNIIASIGIIGGQIMAGQRLFQAVGLNGTLGAAVTTIIVIGYASISGLWGVLMTDVIQVFVVLFGLVLTTIFILSQGGLQIIQATLPAQAFTAVPFSTAEFIMILVPTTVYGAISQASYQRVVSAKSERIAVRSSFYGGLILLPVAFLPVLIGMFGASVFPGEAPGVVFFKVILEAFNPVVSGFIIAAILAAIMSTADSQLLAITANIINDLIKKFGRKDLGDKELLGITIWITLGVGIISLVLALSFGSIVSLFSFVYTILASGCLVPVLGGMLWKDGTKQGANASMVVGILTILLHRFGVFTLPYTILAVVPSLIAFIIVSVMTKGKAGKAA